ncbi:MAG: DUF2284 domain-containing protein [Clostridia bacterium]|nr:DUF2284 domain-containing protein [Clostridia bacterium]
MDGITSTSALVDKLKQLAKEQGGEAVPFKLEELPILESIRIKCQIPLCEDYGICKTCPPNLPPVTVVKELVKEYQLGLLVIWTEALTDLALYRDDFTAELKLHQLVNQLEKEAYQAGYYQTIGLTVGGCKLCPKCTPPGEACRHPFKARPSPEGLGMDVTSLARKLGIPIEWPPKTKVIFLGMILI